MRSREGRRAEEDCAEAVRCEVFGVWP